MTKKDYAKIAKVLRENSDLLFDGCYMELVWAFSSMMKEDNPKFQDTKFVEACLDD